MAVEPTSKNPSLRGRVPVEATLTEFECARIDRFEDARALGRSDRRLGACYLMGYFVEISLKSAYFRLRGWRADEPIRPKDLHEAAAFARTALQVQQPLEGHHGLLFWFDAVVRLRVKSGPETPAGLLQQFSWRIQRLSNTWSTSLRYSRDVTTPSDWAEILLDAEWVRANYDTLVDA